MKLGDHVEVTGAVSEFKGASATTPGTLTEITPSSARWQQFFSVDGTTWEKNWVMQFRRVPVEAS